MVSGFVAVSGLTWRWAFWIALIYAGLSGLLVLFFLPETYSPIILKRRAAEIRRESGNENIFAPIELEKKGAKQLITVTLLRPLRLFLRESLVFWVCIYLALVFGIFYLFFEAYPLIFQGR